MAKKPNFGGLQGSNWKHSGMTPKRDDALAKAHAAAAALRKGTGKSNLPKSTTGKTLTLAKNTPTKEQLRSRHLAKLKTITQKDILRARKRTKGLSKSQLMKMSVNQMIGK